MLVQKNITSSSKYNTKQNNNTYKISIQNIKGLLFIKIVLLLLMQNIKTEKI
jgi:hypothetical protein